jgi:hypothetical protein
MASAATSRRVTLLLAGLLLVGCLWIYRDTLAFGFSGLDDDYNILFNPHLGPLSWSRLEWAFSDVAYSRRYQPLGWAGFAGVFSFSGLAPAGYHVTLVALHLVNALLAFAALRDFAQRVCGDGMGGWREIVAFLGAAFWAWHPLRVESVAWASGLLYGQTVALVLAACWLHLREKRIAAVAFYALALLTYPAALGALPLFVLVDAYRDGWRLALRRNLSALAVTLAAGAITTLGRFHVADTWATVPTLAEFPAWQRVLQALYVWGHYLWRPWWPVDLSPVDPVLLHLAHPSALVLGGAALVLVVAAGLLASQRARASLGWFFLAHLAVLVPMLGFWEQPYFPSDRYGFLAQLILAAALVLALARMTACRALIVVGGVAALLTFAWLARGQTAIWRDESAMWRHVASRLTVYDSPVVGCARPALAAFRAGDVSAALAIVDAGRRELPDDVLLRSVREEIVRTDQENRARAAALGLATPPPPAAVLHHALAAQLARAGDLEAAAQHLAEVARLAPEYYTRVTRRPPSPPAR